MVLTHRYLILNSSVLDQDPEFTFYAQVPQLQFTYEVCFRSTKSEDFSLFLFHSLLHLTQPGLHFNGLMIRHQNVNTDTVGKSCSHRIYAAYLKTDAKSYSD